MAFNENTRVKIPAILHLGRLGYKYLSLSDAKIDGNTNIFTDFFFDMFFERDNWQEIFATIRKNKLRTFLTMLGVFWGIFMLVIMLGSGNGLRNGILQAFSGTATNSFYVWAQQTTKAHKGMKPGRYYNFNSQDIIALSSIEELEVISPMNQLGGYEGCLSSLCKPESEF